MRTLKNWVIDTFNEACNILVYACRWGLIILIVYALWYCAGLLGVIAGAVFWSSYKKFRKDND